MIRKATEKDIQAVSHIYDEIHTEEEAGRVTIGWIRDIYPTEKTAEMALQMGDLYVLEEDGISSRNLPMQKRIGNMMPKNRRSWYYIRWWYRQP